MPEPVYVEECWRMVRNAEADLRSAERNMREYTKGFRLSEEILAARRRALHLALDRWALERVGGIDGSSNRSGVPELRVAPTSGD